MVTTATTASPFQPKLLAAGWASVTGLAVLANPRIIPASKTLVLDVQIYLGPTDDDLLIGSLRFFPPDNLSFEDGPNLYLIHATFARPKAGVLVSDNRPLSDYTFIGDIQWVVPLGPPAPHYQLPHQDVSEGSETYTDPTSLPTFMIDPCVQPSIQLAGVAMDCSKAEATFEVTVEQYISCFRSTKDAGSSHLKPATTFICRIPDSPKYRNCGKPMQGNKRFVSLWGILTAVDRTGDGEVEKYQIDVNNITFGGQYIQVASTNSQSSPVKTSDNAPTALFSYNPRAPQTPPPSKDKASSKRSKF